MPGDHLLQLLDRLRHLARRVHVDGKPDDEVLAVNMDPGVKVSQTIEQLQEIMAWHDGATSWTTSPAAPEAYFSFGGASSRTCSSRLGALHAEALKQVVKHAKVQCESHVRTPRRQLRDCLGQADTVSIVRGQIADPRPSSTRRRGAARKTSAVSCNQMWGVAGTACLINPSAGRELEWGGDPLARAQACVVGSRRPWKAGAVAAERGHQVTLAEASDKLAASSAWPATPRTTRRPSTTSTGSSGS